MSSNAIFKGDDTNAFNNNFLTININNPRGYVISKAIFVCGCLQKVYDNPVFPWIVNFNSKESQTLRPNNVGYLVVFDHKGRQRTCNNVLRFRAQNGVIYHG